PAHPNARLAIRRTSRFLPHLERFVSGDVAPSLTRGVSLRSNPTNERRSAARERAVDGVDEALHRLLVTGLIARALQHDVPVTIDHHREGKLALRVVAVHHLRLLVEEHREGHADLAHGGGDV